MLLQVIRIILTISGLVLIVDCLVLMAVGKVNFSTTVPLFIGTIFIVHGLFWQPIRHFLIQNVWLNSGWYCLWGFFAIWVVSFVVFVGSLQQQIKASKNPSAPVAAIIILGSGTIDGEPTPTLAARLDTAATIIKAQPQALVITSGGIGFGHTRSEADIMATYLHKTHGIRFDQVLQEGDSTSTEENLMNSKVILDSQGIDLAAPIAIVTSDFHTIRAAAIAHRQGYQQPITRASPTPLSVRYNAWFREYFAFISSWILREY